MASSGGGVIQSVLDTVGRVVRDAKYTIIATLIGAEVTDQLIHYAQTGKFQVDFIPDWWDSAINEVVGEAERLIGEPLFKLLVAAPSGATLSGQGSAQEATAVAMVERMLGFAVGLPYATARIKSLLKATMGENAMEPLAEALDKIPEEIGISWALGNVLDRILEVAASQPIEEAIAFQTRPNRMQWQQLRALARVHALSDTELQDRLRKSGWREEDIPLVKQLDRSRLSVGDLQQLYLYGIRDEAYIRDYLGQLGVEDGDVDDVVELYLKRAETAGGDQLRAVAQRQFLDSVITVDQYIAILRRVKVPELSVQLEVEAANMVKSAGQKQLSVAEVKKLHADNIIDDVQAIARLVVLGYTDNDATMLVRDWKVEKVVAHSGVNENRILAYLATGVLTKTEAYDRLVNLSIRPEDASFLVSHPEAGAVVKSHGSAATTIVAAYQDEILDYPTALAKLIDTGLDQDAATLEMQVANYRINRGKKPRQASKSLSEAHVLSALNLGLATSSWATRELVTLGFTEPDAILLVAEEETKVSKKLPEGWNVLT